MKFKIKLLSFAFLGITAISISTAHAETTKLVEDPNLEVAIRDVLQKYSGDITVEDLEKLDTLYQTRKDIKVSSLKGLEYATNLYSLYFANNNISDVSPIANLPKLAKLALGSNKIKDISSLGALPSLTDLSVNHNDIEDVSVLSRSPKLQLLSINHNKIKDISKLGNLKDITFLNIEENQISDISSISSYKSLDRLMANDN
ncbi:leucine-rich repeat domain-containing protein [Paenibacillus sp. WC2504]|uniref:leucine-rich repeat domain-containing protein n=1 Tax=Paenibacillus sp. WC2504 TaxID=3461403 RepID=UPI00404614E5